MVEIEEKRKKNLFLNQSNSSSLKLKMLKTSHFLLAASGRETLLVFSLEMLNSYNCRIYIGLCPPTSKREREQREKWMLGKREAGAGSGMASSSSAANDLSLNWISCLEGRELQGGGGGGPRTIGVCITLPIRRRATVTIAMVSKILAVLLGLCRTHRRPDINMLHTCELEFSAPLICIKAELKVAAPCFPAAVPKLASAGWDAGAERRERVLGVEVAVWE